MAVFEQAQRWSILAHVILVGGFAVVLWTFADGLAALIMKDSVEAAAPQQLSANVLQNIAFVTVGVVFAIGAIGQITNRLLTIIIARQQLEFSNIALREIAPLISAIVTFAIGLWLIFSARGFVRFINATRDFGRDPIPAEESHSN
jgi:hypothetical protein